MSYILYTDKQDEFSCEISVKNASLKNSIARLVVESPNGVSLVFNGKIEGDKCTIPIKRLKGLLEENTRGNVSLEIIVEDTYFSPWKSDFLVQEHTSVKVKVSNQPQKLSNKPIVEVKVPLSLSKHLSGKPKNKKINVYTPLKELSIICEKFGIGKNNIMRRKKDLSQILKEYFKVNPEYNKQVTSILTEIRKFLK